MEEKGEKGKSKRVRKREGKKKKEERLRIEFMSEESSAFLRRANKRKTKKRF